MAYDPQRHNRQSMRLPDYDYGQPGAYFVTICTNRHKRLFGYVDDHAMHVNQNGRVVREEWHRTADIRDNVSLDAFVVMPNHMHGIVQITFRRGTARRAPTTTHDDRQFGKPVPGSLLTIIRAFKSAVTRRINRIHNTPGATVWQRGYYDHVVRNEHDLERIRRYIRENPARWHEDRYYR